MNIFHLQQYKTIYDYYLANAGVTPTFAPMATTYIPNAATQSFWSDISTDLASGASTTALTNFFTRIDTGNQRVEFDADDISLSNQTFTSDKFVIFLDTGIPATSPILCSIEYTEGALSPIDGNFVITFNVEGIAALNDN